MSKSKFMGILALVLFLINVILVGFILLGKGPHPDSEGPRNVIIEKLHFDKQQVEAYDKLIDTHRKNIRAANERIMNLKNQLYSTLLDSSAQIKKDSLINEIGKVQMQIEEIHYNHFIEMKNLCKAEQLKDFDTLTKELSALFAPQRPRKK